MKNFQDDKEAVFTISVGDIQEEAEYLIGRRLTEDEVMLAADGIEWGLCETKHIAFHTAIRQAIENKD